jgi:hypothetical protein
MTRRERHLRIIESFKGYGYTYDAAFRHVISELGMSALTDEAIEMYAARLVSDRRYAEKLNKQNRAIYAAQQRASA